MSNKQELSLLEFLEIILRAVKQDNKDNAIAIIEGVIKDLQEKGEA